MKENWTEAMKQKLERHRMAPPAGLWEGISSEMGLADAPRPTAVKRKYWAVAAAILALVGLFTYHHLEQNHLAEQSGKAEQTNNVPDRLTAPTRHPAVQAISAVASPLPSPVEGKASTQEEIADTHEEIAVNEKEEDNQTKDVQPDTLEKVQQYIADNQPETIRKHSTPHYKPTTNHEKDTRLGKWTVGVDASGGLLAANTTRTGNLYYKDIPVNADVDYITSASYARTDYVWTHRLPMRIGLSLHYQLSPRTALLGGISYTRLSSEFSIPLYQNICYEQTLHYLGIPLGLSWLLWGGRHLRLYLSGSTMVEKCLHTTLSTQHETPLEKPWQWSVNAAAGAEYTLIPQLGIYLEPSLGYFFDDGTTLEHYYKEHPLAPAIQFGFRLHLK